MFSKKEGLKPSLNYTHLFISDRYTFLYPVKIRLNFNEIDYVLLYTLLNHYITQYNQATINFD